MKFFKLIFFSFILIFSVSCVGEDIVDDFVEAELRIENPLESLGINETYQFKVKFFNNVGREEQVQINWSSSDPSIIDVEENSGLATALQSGSAFITATTVSEPITTISTNVEVNQETVEEDDIKSGAIETTSSYTLRGDFTIRENSEGRLVLSLADNYKASASLPGLVVYLTNNPNSIDGALEVAPVTVYEGAHIYNLPENIEINDYDYLLYWCKPFSVKVGGGDIN